MTAPDSYAVHAGTMFDGVRVSGPATVQVTGGRIVGVHTTPGESPRGGRDVIDLGSQTCLLPGLIDCHVHLAFDAGPDPVAALVAADDADLLARMRSAAGRAVRAGITTVRDLGDRGYLALALAREFERQPERGPEILAAGPPITTPRGHCFFLGGAATGKAALRAAVRERHARGCAVIKVMASGGAMTAGTAPHESQYPLADLRVVVDEAHRLGLPVAAHVHGTAAIRDALASGVDTLEHVTFLTADGCRPAPALLRAIADSDSLVSATIGADPRVRRDVAPVLAGQLDTIFRTYHDLHELGAGVVIGTDAGIGPYKPHDVLPYAVCDMVRIGVSSLDALVSVTSLAARACGLDGRKGRITPGADADLLAVYGDPVRDPTRLRDVHAVFRAGVRVR